MADRLKCRECAWIGTRVQLLDAPHPFQPGESILGCPSCKAASDIFLLVCDEPGCNNAVSCGWPDGVGYRRTCDEHGEVIRPRTGAKAND